MRQWMQDRMKEAEHAASIAFTIRTEGPSLWKRVQDEINGIYSDYKELSKQTGEQLAVPRLMGDTLKLSMQSGHTASRHLNISFSPNDAKISGGGRVFRIAVNTQNEACLVSNENREVSVEEACERMMTTFPFPSP